MNDSLTVSGTPSAAWRAYTQASSVATVYHSTEWMTAVSAAFGCETYFLERRSNSGSIVGILPVVRQKSIAFGDRLTSVAFGSYGGPVADDPEVCLRLMSDAQSLATTLGCSRLELRDLEPRPGCTWRLNLDKVTFELPLPASYQQLMKQIGAKLRAQVRRSDRENISLRAGGNELLPAFYRVFAENMRDLGTPVYPRQFFDAVLRNLGPRCRIIVVDWNNAPAGAALLIKTRNRVEVPWAASTSASRPISLNMRLYGELLRVAVDWGADLFDFGRCSIDSGTYRFKKQWGAVPRQLFWYNWARDPAAAGADPARRARGYEIMSAMWQRLPLPVANLLGPMISPGLPW